jgi:hypothetical protein
VGAVGVGFLDLINNGEYKMIFQITLEDIGRNGFTKRDIGKWAIMDTIARVFYVRKTRDQCEEIRNALTQ